LWRGDPSLFLSSHKASEMLERPFTESQLKLIFVSLHEATVWNINKHITWRPIWDAAYTHPICWDLKSTIVSYDQGDEDFELSTTTNVTCVELDLWV